MQSAGVGTDFFAVQGRTRKFFAELAKDMGLREPEGVRAKLDMYPKLIQVAHGGKHARALGLRIQGDDLLRAE
jgi:hypothetical protein